MSHDMSFGLGQVLAGGLLVLAAAGWAGCHGAGYPQATTAAQPLKPGLDPDLAARLPFTPPSGWTGSAEALPPDGSAPATDLHARLQDSSGACQIDLSRMMNPMPTHDWAVAVENGFTRRGTPIEFQPVMSLDGHATEHFAVHYPSGVLGQVYVLRSGYDLITLITLHAAHCDSDFGFALDGFRG